MSIAPRYNRRGWSNFPLTRILIPYSLGIIWSYSVDFPFKVELLVIGLISLFFYPKMKEVLWTLLLTFTSFLAGLIWAKHSDILQHSSHFSQYITPGERLTMSLVILNEGNVKEQSILFEANILALQESENEWILTKGKLPLYYLSADDSVININYGDTLIIQGYLNSITAPPSPYHFNYADFMYYKGYSHQAFIKNNHLLQIKSYGGKVPLLIQVRKKIKEILSIHVNDTLTRSLMAAVLVNDRSEMSKDLRVHFSQTGIAHIIAISGMHVSILCGFLLFLIPFIHHKIGRILVLVLSIVVVWSYIAITDFPASAIRAASMFSLSTLAIFLNRKANSINNLSTTALLMLTYQPIWIWDVGFQLSFLAVLSILCFNHYLFKIWKPKNKILIYLWNIIVISISVQILVFPLILYYFNSFPIFVLLANIPAVIYSFTLLSGSFLIVLISFIWPGLAQFLAEILTWVTQLFYQLIEWLSIKTPLFFHEFSINKIELVLLYLLIFSLILSSKKMKIRYWYISSSLIILLYSYIYIKNSNQYTSTFIYVFQENKKDFIFIKIYDNGYLISDSLLSTNGFQYQLQPLIVGFQIKNIQAHLMTNWTSIQINDFYISKNKDSNSYNYLLLDQSHLHLLKLDLSDKQILLSSSIPWPIIDSLEPHSIPLHYLGQTPYFSTFK